MLSYWEHESFTTYDIAIVGAGITGLSTAIELKTKQPNLNIVVLERGLIPTGASTKNAGFACVGSLTEILDDLEIMQEETVISLVKLRKEGLEILRKRFGDTSIGYEAEGSYELCLDDHDYSSEIDRVNSLLFPVFGKKVFTLSNKKFGFSSTVKKVIESCVEGQIDTGKMMKCLILQAGKIGIEIKTGYTVKGLKTEGDFIKIDNSELTLFARQVCVCANAFAQSILPDLELKPGRGQVLITKPIENMPFSGVFHFSQGYYYFRSVGNRVLFGGGRQLDFKGEETSKFDLSTTIQKDLEEKLSNMILPNTAFEVDRRWVGIMAFGRNKEPIIKQIDRQVFAAVRFGGMGIAIGSKAGEIIAGLMLKKNDL